ncbi:hypothetical protein [Brevundimonas sp.]|uniref:hypothetical protein n=1 Tax=Brevundimonas sp. TaxID=1871086 RepID=UPI0028AAA3C2|nr:hypothetical protein [Brevundimonas sp.]
MADFVDISEMSSELQLMIGTGSHLDPAEFDPLIMLASLRVMQNAAREGLNDDALTIVSLLLMVWVRQLRDNPDNGGLVKTTAEDPGRPLRMAGGQGASVPAGARSAYPDR